MIALVKGIWNAIQIHKNANAKIVILEKIAEFKVY